MYIGIHIFATTHHSLGGGGRHSAGSANMQQQVCWGLNWWSFFHKHKYLRHISLRIVLLHGANFVNYTFFMLNQRGQCNHPRIAGVPLLSKTPKLQWPSTSLWPENTAFITAWCAESCSEAQECSSQTHSVDHRHRKSTYIGKTENKERNRSSTVLCTTCVFLDGFCSRAYRSNSRFGREEELQCIQCLPATEFHSTLGLLMSLKMINYIKNLGRINFALTSTCGTWSWVRMS